jgi:hypothetical protein
VHHVMTYVPTVHPTVHPTVMHSVLHEMLFGRRRCGEGRRWRRRLHHWRWSGRRGSLLSARRQQCERRGD